VQNIGSPPAVRDKQDEIRSCKYVAAKGASTEAAKRDGVARTAKYGVTKIKYVFLE